MARFFLDFSFYKNVLSKVFSLEQVQRFLSLYFEAEMSAAKLSKNIYHKNKDEASKNKKGVQTLPLPSIHERENIFKFNHRKSITAYLLLSSSTGLDSIKQANMLFFVYNVTK